MEMFQGNIGLALIPALVLALMLATPVWFVLKRTALGPPVVMSIFVGDVAITAAVFAYIFYAGILV